MTISLGLLANRPASSITDEEVAAALEIIRADSRVTKAIHIGRENGDPNGRQLIDFEMTGFAGQHVLGRVISAFYEADRLAAAAAEKAKKAADKKAAARKKKLASLTVPREGQDKAFDEWAYDVEVDLVGVPGELTDDPAKRAELYLDYLEQQSTARRRKGAAAGAKTRAKNEAKGISQKGLTGSTKQKRWASEIRGTKLSGFSAENQTFFAENDVAASFWIEYRDISASRISAVMDRIYAEMKEAIRIRVAYAEANATPHGVPVNRDYRELLDAAQAATNRMHKLLDGDLKGVM